MMQGINNEDIARGIDEHMIRQPLGVVAAITPFNFPLMVPMWFLPSCGGLRQLLYSEAERESANSVNKLMALVEQAGFPKGVIQAVNGSKEVVDAILDHPLIRAISFVGSTGVGEIYLQPRHSQRQACAGAGWGEDFPIVIMPDADMDTTTRIAVDSAFGCAGQRCLAASVGITVGAARNEFLERIADTAVSRKVAMASTKARRWGR